MTADGALELLSDDDELLPEVVPEELLPAVPEELLPDVVVSSDEPA